MRWINTTKNEILLSYLFSNFVRSHCKKKRKQSISSAACNLSFAIRSRDTNRGNRGGYLFLSKFNSEFQPVQVHPLAVLERWPGGIVVQQHLQLVGTSRVIQQGSGKVLALSPKLLESQHCLVPRRETSFVNNAEEARNCPLLVSLSSIYTEPSVPVLVPSSLTEVPSLLKREPRNFLLDTGDTLSRESLSLLKEVVSNF